MKKIIACAILLVLCITLIACETNTSPIESEEMTTISDVGLTEEETEHHVKVETEEQNEETEPVGCEHKIVTEPEIPATCVADGMTKSRYCSKCGESFEDAEVIPALGHQKDADSDNCVYCQKNYWVCVAEENISIRLNVYHPNTSENSMCDIYVQNMSNYDWVSDGNYLTANGKYFQQNHNCLEIVDAQTSRNVYYYAGIFSAITEYYYLDNESIATGWFELNGNQIHYKCNTKGDVVFATSYQEVKNMMLGE